jgi:hypothetical protein
VRTPKVKQTLESAERTFQLDATGTMHERARRAASVASAALRTVDASTTEEVDTPP